MPCEKETDSVFWKSAERSKRLIHCLLDVSRTGREGYIRQEYGKAGESVDPWADEQRELRRRATVYVLCGPVTQ